MAVAAPPNLLELTHKAALQEIHHAKLCFDIAHRLETQAAATAAVDETQPLQFGSVGPFPLPPLLEVCVDLVCVAKSTAMEGAVGETLAAYRAAVLHRQAVQRLHQMRRKSAAAV